MITQGGECISLAHDKSPTHQLGYFQVPPGPCPQLQQGTGNFALQQSQGKSTVESVRVQTSAELPGLLQLHTEPMQMFGGKGREHDSII